MTAFVHNLDEAFAYIKDEFGKLETKLSNLSDRFPPGQELIEYSTAYEMVRVFDTYNKALDLFKYKDDPDAVYAGHKASYDAAIAEVARIEESNKAIIANNKKAREAIGEMMKYYGIPEHYYEIDPKSRAWPKKKVKVNAGWVNDVSKSLPIFSSSQTAKSSLDGSLQNLKKAHDAVKLGLYEDYLKVNQYVKDW
jgi:hypothetical protein